MTFLKRIDNLKYTSAQTIADAELREKNEKIFSIGHGMYLVQIQKYVSNVMAIQLVALDYKYISHKLEFSKFVSQGL